MRGCGWCATVVWRFIYKSDAEIALHDYRSAAASLRTALDLSQRHNLKDAILEIYDKLSNCYSLMGDKESSLAFAANTYSSRTPCSTTSSSRKSTRCDSSAA